MFDQPTEEALKSLTLGQVTVLFWTCKGFDTEYLASHMGYDVQWVRQQLSEIYVRLGFEKEMRPSKRARILRKEVCPVLMELLGNEIPTNETWPPSITTELVPAPVDVEPQPSAPPPAFTTAIVLVEAESEKFPPPPLAAPPIVVHLKWILGLSVITAIMVVLMGWLFGGARLVFITKMTLLMLSVCSTPSLVFVISKQRGRVIRILLETILFTIVIIIFSVWLLGTNSLGIWLVYPISLILTLEIGAHLVERYLVMALRRVPKSVYVERSISSLEKSFYDEWVLYISVPLGLMTGLVTGLVRDWTPQETVVFCIQQTLTLACAILLLFLIYACVQMADPLLKASSIPTPTIVNEPVRHTSGIWHNILKVFRLVIPHQRFGKELQEQQDLLFAYISTDLRKAYFYDSIHNVILFISFASAIAGLSNVPIDPRLLIFVVFILSVLFNQLPFIIGQHFLHDKILARYDGLERADMSEKLKKYAPLFPTADFLTALFTTGTAGGFIYYLIDQFVKSLLK